MKRKNGEGSWGTKTINGFSYYYYRNSEGKYYYATTMKELKAKIKKATTTTTSTKKQYIESLRNDMAAKRKSSGIRTTHL